MPNLPESQKNNIGEGLSGMAEGQKTDAAVNDIFKGFDQPAKLPENDPFAKNTSTFG